MGSSYHESQVGCKTLQTSLKPVISSYHLNWWHHFVLQCSYLSLKKLDLHQASTQLLTWDEGDDWRSHAGHAGHAGAMGELVTCTSDPTRWQGVCWIFSGLIWQCVKTLYPCSSHQNSWDLWMFIPLNMVLIGIDPYPYEMCLAVL